MSSKICFYATTFAIFIANVLSQAPVTLLVVVELPDAPMLKNIRDFVAETQSKLDGNLIKVDVKSVEVDREHVDDNFAKVCAQFETGITMILDMTWTGWDKLRDLATNNGIIYKRGDTAISSYVQAMDDLMMKKNTTDLALIFEDERELNQTLYYLIGNSIIRLVVIDSLSEQTVAQIRSMRPLPSYYVIYSSTKGMEKLFKTAVDGGLVKRDGIWNLVFTDYKYQQFSYFTGIESSNVTVTVMVMKEVVCCHLLGLQALCACPKDFPIFFNYLKRLTALLMNILNEMEKSSELLKPTSGKCDSNERKITAASNASIEAFDRNLMMRVMKNDSFVYVEPRTLITYRAEMELKLLNGSSLESIGTWDQDKRIQPLPGQKIEAAKRYFRVGTAQAVPWTTKKKDPTTGKDMLDQDGNVIWEGYCLDFIAKLSKLMDFDYDLVIPADGSFGVKKDGAWDGLVGDLAKGETDIAVAALTMTSEREEVIDFVAPYFEQSGILIVMRKPVRKTSLFKFMTVLRLEVWLSIVGALTLTGIMIWVLDKYSPYSARNNKHMYPYACREFTLKESFWFALTSFTPQGGGEAPKALSSRTLVAAYWLFVVLMLATFTANLAAFLTVERMQSPVQSLEQLARQSRINYTVLMNSSIHQYFKNMRSAEEKLYTMWKEITLNSSSDQVEYRVWDYPIKEQYGHILQAIEQAGPVKTIDEGFAKVLASEDAEFAFIHDSSEIKYRVTENCNLTEVGEVFAEQPYAIAVQQGSHLQEEISRKILDLQKDRYFETLSGKYWNQSKKLSCPNSDDSEGITLESLGGVFIATLFGLALAMVTLAGEVIYYRRRNAKQGDKPKDTDKDSQKVTEKDSDNQLIKKLATKLQLKPAPPVAFDKKSMGQKPRISHISVYPRPFPFKD